jgi:hypothetical protein
VILSAVSCKEPFMPFEYQRILNTLGSVLYFQEVLGEKKLHRFRLISLNRGKLRQAVGSIYLFHDCQ